jgi:nicotinamide riboside kinase
MKKIRRISLFGGPGSGKSTLSARIFAEMKMLNYNIEQVMEFVKQMAYEGRNPQGYDELHIFGEQIHREEMVLRHVPLIVTDCPPLMNVVYARAIGFVGWEALLKIAKDWDEEYPSLNLYLARSFSYKPEGRFQSEEQADVVASDILSMMSANIDFKVVRLNNDGSSSLTKEGLHDVIPSFDLLMRVIQDAVNGRPD